MLACREGHLRDLHGRLGVQGLHVDGEHVLIGIAGSHGLSRGSSHSQAVEVHGLRGEEADGGLEAVGSNLIAGIAEEHDGQRTVGGG